MIDSPKSSSLAADTDWYAIYTRHQHEKMVARGLTMKGFETLLPLYPVSSRWKDRTKLLSLPLFPCYVFLKGGLDRRSDIVTTPGIHGLVSNAGKPAAIPAIEIDAVRKAIESGLRLEPHPFLKCGERVIIKCGPLEGIQGILVRKKNICRLVLSVELLGTAASLEVDAFLVERLNKTRVYSSGYSTAFIPHDRQFGMGSVGSKYY